MENIDNPKTKVYQVNSNSSNETQHSTTQQSTAQYFHTSDNSNHSYPRFSQIYEDQYNEKNYQNTIYEPEYQSNPNFQIATENSQFSDYKIDAPQNTDIIHPDITQPDITNPGIAHSNIYENECIDQITQQNTLQNTIFCTQHDCSIRERTTIRISSNEESFR